MADKLENVLNQQSVQIKVWEDLEEGGFIAECVDIPGCMSQGETRNQALANIVEAITACIEVIAEDAGVDVPASGPEVLELPVSHFLHASR